MAGKTPIWNNKSLSIYICVCVCVCCLTIGECLNTLSAALKAPLSPWPLNLISDKKFLPSFTLRFKKIRKNATYLFVSSHSNNKIVLYPGFSQIVSVFTITDTAELLSICPIRLPCSLQFQRTTNINSYTEKHSYKLSFMVAYDYHKTNL
jgi:hypothetical protein